MRSLFGRCLVVLEDSLTFALIVLINSEKIYYYTFTPHSLCLNEQLISAHGFRLLLYLDRLSSIIYKQMFHEKGKINKLYLNL
jgi:DNA integrity scanning protein DisA with diadenylate cyclase activity